MKSGLGIGTGWRLQEVNGLIRGPEPNALSGLGVGRVQEADRPMEQVQVEVPTCETADVIPPRASNLVRPNWTANAEHGPTALLRTRQ